MVRKWILVGGLAVVGLAALTLAGCNKLEPEPAPAGDPRPAAPADEHAHKPGAHGGIIVALGRDSYHVEAVFEKGGLVRLYTLGKDEARVQEALARNPILVTALNPIIGYARAAEIAKRAYKENRPIIEVAEEMSGLPRAELERLLDPAALTAGGIVAGGGGGG